MTGVFWITALAIASNGQAPQVERPAPLQQGAGCMLWRGVSSGNDPSVQVELELCPAGEGKVRGRTQESSLLSGSNVRSLEGTWSEVGGTLHDTAFLSQDPAPGWRFCLVDEYRFNVVSDHVVEARFDSQACDDHGTLRLEWAGEGAGLPPLPAAKPANEEASSERPCGCAASPPGGVALLGGLLAAWRRKRSARC